MIACARCALSCNSNDADVTGRAPTAYATTTCPDLVEDDERLVEVASLARVALAAHVHLERVRGGRRALRARRCLGVLLDGAGSGSGSGSGGGGGGGSRCGGGARSV